METPQRRGAAESIDSLIHRCDDASPERGETTRREETNPEVAAPDGDVGGDDGYHTGPSTGSVYIVHTL